MIIQEHFEVNGKDFIRTYSDEGRYVVGGNPSGSYAQALDPAEFNREYTEGDLLPVEERTDIQDKAEAYDILTGVSK